jgi:hypothetical protein
MRRFADYTWPTGKITRFGNAEILLAHMTSVCSHVLQQIGMIINNQRNTGGFGNRQHRLHQIGNFGLRTALGPDLKNVNAAGHKLVRYQSDVPIQYIAEINYPVQ